MRILQILPELNVGGVETGTVDFARYLQEHGYFNVVVSNGGALVAELEHAGVRHYQRPVHQKSLFSILRNIPDLRKIIIADQIDIVHARSRVPGWIAFFACRGTNAQLITTCHGHYRASFFSRVMGWSKIVIVPSGVIGRHMIGTFHVPAERIRCIPRSVDLKRFSLAHKESTGQEAPVVTIIGRLTALKGHVYFLRAMVKVLRSMPYVRVRIVGDAPAKDPGYRKELESLARHLGIGEAVEFLGHRKDIPELLAETDVLVMSSVVPESFGRVILEAQAAGVPVVATSVGGVVEIIDDERTGLLVLPKDIDTMSQAVLRLLNDRKLAARIVEAAKKKLQEQFTLEHMATRTLAAYEELSNSQNILVIKLSALGDVILITASLRALRKKFPRAKIVCLLGRPWRHVLQRCPYIDDLILVDLEDKSWPALWQLGKKLRQYHFDKVVDFQNTARTHVLAALSCARESYGFRRGKMGFLLSHGVPLPKEEMPPVQHQFKILEGLGLNYSPDLRLELWPTENDERTIRQLLESEWIGPETSLVGVNLSASEQWPTKNWPLEYIARLCDLLAVWNIRVVLTGMERDRPAASRVIQMTKAKPANLTGKTDIIKLVALIKRCQVFLTPDSAPLHMAAAMKTPLIAFFGPTSSARHLPPANAAVVLEKKPKCAPCYGKVCKIKTHDCMRQIRPEDVAQQVKKLISERV